MGLLASNEPPPFEVVRHDGPSPFVFLCDHASRRIPRSLGTLGLTESELGRHIAWDIGAAGLARGLCQHLGGFLALQNYSRLVIDCNRRLDRPDSIPVASEDTPIPGNVGLSAEAARERATEIFEPYHARINEELDARAGSERQTVVVFVHSFTPSYRGVERPWHAGVLHHKDTRLAFPILGALRKQPDLVVGDNQPYAASALSDYGIVEHAERRGLLHVELEVRQDLIEASAGQAIWAERLARILSEALGVAMT